QWVLGFAPSPPPSGRLAPSSTHPNPQPVAPNKSHTYLVATAHGRNPMALHGDVTAAQDLQHMCCCNPMVLHGKVIAAQDLQQHMIATQWLSTAM
ncbi:unnamed protein product, partial [Musa acuminata subsp. burmannicoides]